MNTTSLLREVARLHSQLQREGVACCGGTTSTQCSILTEIGRSGSMTLAELGRRLGVDKGWVSRAVESMTQEGLLLKQPGSEDKRTVTISLSEGGRCRYEELNLTLNAQSDRILSRIPTGEQEALLRSLGLLLQAMKAEAAGNPVLIRLDEEEA